MKKYVEGYFLVLRAWLALVFGLVAVKIFCLRENKSLPTVIV